MNLPLPTGEIPLTGFAVNAGDGGGTPPDGPDYVSISAQVARAGPPAPIPNPGGLSPYSSDHLGHDPHSLYGTPRPESYVRPPVPEPLPPRLFGMSPDMVRALSGPPDLLPETATLVQGRPMPQRRIYEDADPLLVECMQHLERITAGGLLQPSCIQMYEDLRRLGARIREEVCEPVEVARTPERSRESQKAQVDEQIARIKAEMRAEMLDMMREVLKPAAVAAVKEEKTIAEAPKG